MSNIYVKLLCVLHALVDEQTAEHITLATATKQAKDDFDTFPNSVQKLKDEAIRCDNELSVVARSV